MSVKRPKIVSTTQPNKSKCRIFDNNIHASSSGKSTNPPVQFTEQDEDDDGQIESRSFCGISKGIILTKINIVIS
jgi:hypothetical protein